MTISVNNQQMQLSPALRNMMNSPSNSIQNTSSKNQNDIFVKKTGSQRNLNGIIKAITSIGVLVIAGVCTSKVLKLVDRLTDAMPSDAPKQLSDIWEDITPAIKIGDMSLSQNLKVLLNKVVKNIENPDAIVQRGGKGIKTILLYGPPGTGKTTFAKAIAKEFPNSKFATLDVTNLGSKFVGETEKNIQAAVNEICAEAKKNPNTKFFVFVDEIDSIMMVDDGSNKKYSNDVLNEFKRCFTERLGKENNIITIGATNLSIDTETAKTFDGKKLDKPMLDRFQEKIFVDLPTKEQIADYFCANYKGKAKVCDELKDKNSQSLKVICEFLEDKQRQVSFRTLQTLFEDIASGGDLEKRVEIQDVYNVLKLKKIELKITDEQLIKLAQELNVTP